MRDLIESMPLARLLGVTLVDVSPEKIIGELIVRDELCTVGSSVHGGTLMAMADCLGAIGAFLTLPDNATGTTTIESKTNFLGPAPSGSTLTGVATPVSVGRRISVWQTKIDRDDGRPVALVVQSQLVL